MTIVSAFVSPLADPYRTRFIDWMLLRAAGRNRDRTRSVNETIRIACCLQSKPLANWRQPSRMVEDENMFKALFTPYNERTRHDVAWTPYRRRLKWDWHLRNFLYALLPAAAIFLFCEAVEYRYDLKKSFSSESSKNDRKTRHLQDAAAQSTTEMRHDREGSLTQSVQTSRAP